MVDLPDKPASAEERACSAAPDTPKEERKLFLMTMEEVASHISIAVAVIHPPIQIGRGRKLPHESDRDRKTIGNLIATHFERSGIRWYIRQIAPWHGGPAAKEKPSGGR